MSQTASITLPTPSLSGKGSERRPIRLSKQTGLRSWKPCEDGQWGSEL